jgi:hypothetical protein
VSPQLFVAVEAAGHHEEEQTVKVNEFRSAAWILGVALVVGSTGFLLEAEPPQAVDTWASIGTSDPQASRTGAAVATLPDGKTLVAGGLTSEGTVTDGVVIHDPLTNSSTQVGQLQVARVNASAARLDDGRILITGGDVADLISADAEIFDPVTGNSTFVALMAQPRTGHVSAPLGDGTVLIVGGLTTDGVALATTERFDPATNSITPAASMAVARAGASATVLIDGRVLVAGGHDGRQDQASAEIYSPFDDTFLAVETTMSVARSGHSAVLLPHNNSVLIAGGTSAGAAVASVDLFLPTMFPDPYSWGMGSFGPTNAMVQARSHGVAGPWGDDGYAFAMGGGPSDGEVYRFATIKTDKDDYAPGEHATITGSGWEPNEEITLTFQEDPAVHPDYVLTVTADEEGNFNYNQWAPEEHDLNVRFYLMAAGEQSERRVQITFTDSKPNSVTVTPSPVSVAPGGSAVYTVTVNFNGNGNSCTSPLSITSALPAGAVATFAPTSVTSMGGDVSSTLTITTTGATPSGSTVFGVLAANGGGTCQSGTASGNGTLVVDGVAPITASVTTPANGGTFSTASVPATFSGNAADNLNGAGLNANSTTFTLQRPDLQYWNGTAWQAAAVQLAATHVATTSSTSVAWTDNVALPTWASQPVGLYTVQARATDKVGNTFTGTAVTFTLQSAATRLAFTSAAFSGVVNQCLGPVQVQTQNASSVATNVTSNTTVSLATDGTGAFFSNNTCTSGIASVLISTGNSAASFYYKPTARGDGTHGLTVSASGLTSASQTQDVDLAEQATVTITAPSTVAYGLSPSVSGGGGSGTGAFSYSHGASTACTVNGSSGALTITSGTGTCVVTATKAADSNFNAATSAPATVTINKAPLTITADSNPSNAPINPFNKTYDGLSFTPFTVRYSGFVNGDTSADLDGTLTFSGAGATEVNAGGPYNVTPGGLTSDDYAISFVTGTITINTASLIVRADADPTTAPTETFTKTYDGLVYSAFAVRYTGFVNGETAAVLGGTVTFTGPGATAVGAGGPFVVTPAGLTSTNYTISFQNGTVTISRAPLSVTADADPGDADVDSFSKSYDGQVYSGFTARYEGLVNGETSSILGGTLFFTGAGTTAINAGGPHVVVPAGLTSANYLITFGAGSLTIGKANATVVVTPYSVTYNGGPHTAIVTSISGVNGETGATVGTVDLSGTTHTNAGTYDDDPWTFTGTANYHNTSGTVDDLIEKATSTTEVTIVGGSFTYTGSPITPATVSVTGVGGLSLTPAADYVSNVNAGTATASYTFAGDANHEGSNDSETFEIGKATSTTVVTIVGGPFTYTGSPIEPATVSVTGAGGLSLAPAAVYANNVNAGTATASYTFAGDANHEGSNDSETFEIGKAASTTVVTIVGGPFTYTGSPIEPAEVSVTGAGGLHMTPAASYVNNVNAGTATASFAFTGDANHDGSSDSETFEIGKADATFTVSGYSVTFNAAPHSATVSAITGVNGETGATVGSVDLSSTTHTNAGIYAGDAWSFTGGANYNDDSGTVDSDIAKADAACTINGYSGTFDATAHGATGSCIGVTLDLSATGSTLDLGDSFTNAPGGTANWAFTGGANYHDQNGSVAITIGKVNAVCTINGYSGVFDGAAHGATGSCAGVVLDPTAVGSSLNLGNSFTNAPGGTANWAFTGGTNYHDQNGSVAITIGKVNAVCTINGYSGVFDGAAHSASGSCAGVVLDPTAVGSSLNLGNSFTNAPGGTANWAFTGGTNYHDQNGSVGITIGKANAVCTINGYSNVYDGNAHGATGSCAGVTLDPTAAGSTLNLGASFTDVPGGTATWAFTGGTNYYNQGGTKSISITQKELTVSGVVANNKPFDGNTAATLNFAGASLVGVVSPDAVTLVTAGATGTFATPAVGGPKVVTIAGLTLGSADAGNYSLTQPTAMASITAWKVSGYLSPVGVSNSYAGTPAVASSTIWNTVKGGQTVPLKFELFTAAGGAELTNLADVTGFSLVTLPCTPGNEDPVDLTLDTPGSTTLGYDGSQYHLNWQTPKGAGKCYRMTMTARDGSQLSAFFKTK